MKVTRGIQPLLTQALGVFFVHACADKGATGANEDGGSGSSSDTRKESPTMIGAQDRPPPLGGDPAKDNFVDLLDDDADESPRGGSGGGGDGTGGGGGDGTDEEFDELLL